jgi:ankyrin repeat protein
METIQERKERSSLTRSKSTLNTKTSTINGKMPQLNEFIPRKSSDTSTNQSSSFKTFFGNLSSSNIKRKKHTSSSASSLSIEEISIDDNIPPYNALNLAIYQNRLDQVETVLARPKINVNASDESGNTPLHYAAKQKKPHIISALLKDTRIIASIKNKNGKTARELIPVSTDKRLPNNSLRAILFERMSIERQAIKAAQKLRNTNNNNFLFDSFLLEKTDKAFKKIIAYHNDQTNDRTLPIEEQEYLTKNFLETMIKDFYYNFEIINPYFTQETFNDK